MHINKNDIPVVMAVPGATARQMTAVGNDLAAEYFSLAAGTDIAPLLHGLEGDACQVAHWGYVISGTIVVTYTDGYGPERCVAGDCFYWPAGHSVRVDDDAEVVLFSPHDDHAAVIDHMKTTLASMT
jgi:hypothetical protein